LSLKHESTQVIIKDIKADDFFDNGFVGIMKKHFPDFNILSFVMYTLDEKHIPDKRIMIYHKAGDNIKNKILTVDTDNPEDLNKMLKVMEEFYKNK